MRLSNLSRSSCVLAKLGLKPTNECEFNGTRHTRTHRDGGPRAEEGRGGAEGRGAAQAQEGRGGAGRGRRRGRGSAQAREGGLGGELALDVGAQVPAVPVPGAQREGAGDPPGSARDLTVLREGRLSADGGFPSAGASRPCASSSRSGALRAGGAQVRQRAQVGEGDRAGPRP